MRPYTERKTYLYKYTIDLNVTKILELLDLIYITFLH